MRFLIVTALFVAVLVGISIYHDIYSKQDYVLGGMMYYQTPTPSSTAEPIPAATVSPYSMDDFITYTVPQNWKKEMSLDGDPRLVTLYSPNYRYNSSEGPDRGLQIVLRRELYDSSQPLAESLQKQANENPFHDDDDRTIRRITIDGAQGFSMTSASDGRFDPNYPHLIVVHNGYLYSFLFYGDGTGLRDAVDQFIQSIRFK